MWRLTAWAMFVVVAVAVPGHAGPLVFGDAVDRFGLPGTSGVVASPDGRHVYTATPATAIDDVLVAIPMVLVFAREADGALTFVESQAEGVAIESPLCGAGAPFMSPDGRHLYVPAGCSGDAPVQVFARDESTGRLTRQTDGIVRPVSGADGFGDGDPAFAITPDGRHVYVADAGVRRTEIAVYERDGDTGRLVWIGGLEPDAGDARQRDIGSIAVSPDGRHVYVVQEDSTGPDGRLLAYTRDAETGTLSLLQTITDGADGFAVLNDFHALVSSADGRHVYAGPFSNPGGGVMITFARDEVTGRLTVVQTLEVDRLVRGRSLALAPSGGLLVVGHEDALSVFARDPETGRLSPWQVVQDGDDGVDHGVRLGGSVLSRLVNIPDDEHVYVAASGGLIRFDVACGDGRLDADEACDDGNLAAGDGCDLHCDVEPCFACAGDPSVCTPLDGAPCEDGNACTTGKTCSLGVCMAGGPMADGASCDDGNACTTQDACAAGICVGGQPPACDVCSRCDRRLGCVGFVETGCFASADVGRHGRLRIERRQGGGTRLVWRWATPGATHGLDDLGDPTTDTEYALCVFDPRDLGFARRRRQRRVVAAFELPAGGECAQGPCWTRRDDGYRYRDRGPGQGVRRARLRGGGAGSTLLVKARRSGDPDELPLSLPAAAQLRASNGACWETTYQEFVARNRARLFEARGGLQPKRCRPPESSSCTE